MGELLGERRRETEKNRKRDRKREGGVKQMCQNCIPTMNMNTLCIMRMARCLLVGLDFSNIVVMKI